MRTSLFTLLSLMFLWFSPVQAQDGTIEIPGEIIVQTFSANDIEAIEEDFTDALSLKETVSTRFLLYTFEYTPDAALRDKLLQQLRQHPSVRLAAPNFKAHMRATTPDDTSYPEQWDMERIQAPDAWDITTGGATADGREIVVAVLEGTDPDHEDLEENIWVNRDEIPDDGVDNDNNGYVDDYFGVNVVTGTDEAIVDNHAASVSGIIGAKGNNGTGVTGINWDVKMMIVSHDLTFPKIIQSYEYVYEMRKRYNESNGEQGAFVVSTNASFGVDRRFPDSNPFFPIWCALYDTLGQVGILSAAATNNDPVDIDEAGDVPGHCDSDYLIMVTDTDIDDELDGGFSSTRIDLSAPGKGSYTTRNNSQYGSFSGTSAATPHVSGAIGLLYSFPCIDFIEEAIAEPAETALWLKNVILDNTDPLPDLDGKTVSGGRLNVFKALSFIQSVYGNPKGDLDILKIFPNPVLREGMITVEYRTPEFTEYTMTIYNSLGQKIYRDRIPEVCAPRNLEIPVSGWAPGVYFITVENINNITSYRFVIQ